MTANAPRLMRVGCVLLSKLNVLGADAEAFITVTVALGCVSKLTTAGSSHKPSRSRTASVLTCECKATSRPCVFSTTTAAILPRHFGHNVKLTCVRQRKGVRFSTHHRRGRHFEYVSLVTLRKLLGAFHTHGSDLVTMVGSALNSWPSTCTCVVALN